MKQKRWNFTAPAFGVEKKTNMAPTWLNPYEILRVTESSETDNKFPSSCNSMQVNSKRSDNVNEEN